MKYLEIELSVKNHSRIFYIFGHQTNFLNNNRNTVFIYVFFNESIKRKYLDLFNNKKLPLYIDKGKKLEIQNEFAIPDNLRKRFRFILISELDGYSQKHLNHL